MDNNGAWLFFSIFLMTFNLILMFQVQKWQDKAHKYRLQSHRLTLALKDFIIAVDDAESEKLGSAYQGASDVLASFEGDAGNDANNR